ncbi:hypothetical protein AGABI1DRAFT_115159, partial [Agaricus bisporus var. burnettii JB137-S8]
MRRIGGVNNLKWEDFCWCSPGPYARQCVYQAAKLVCVWSRGNITSSSHGMILNSKGVSKSYYCRSWVGVISPVEF